MDYEKAYNEALKRAIEYSEGHSIDVNPQAAMEYVFPELKESEDDKIRKAIRIYLDWLDGRKDCAPRGEYSIMDMLAWIEKQGGQKPTDTPKFKVGDFIADYYCRGSVVALTDDAYLLDSGQGIPFSCEDNIHLWTIQDAKDGDVLASHESLVLFKELDGLNIKCYCNYHFMNNPCFHVNTLQNKDAFYPATKAQRDLLFQKMKEAGYKWDAEKKELRKIDARENLTLDGDLMQADCMMIEQKPAWSEEDEKMLDSIIDRIDGAFIDPDQWVDLGLPSGTLWKNTNETNPNDNHDFYTYDEAMKKYGDQMPTKEQWDELKDCCEWTWEGTGYKVTGWNGYSIFLPIANYSDCDDLVHYVGSNGFYWSSMSNSSEFARILNFNSGEVFIGFCRRDYCRSVRLVHEM